MKSQMIIFLGNGLRLVVESGEITLQEKEWTQAEIVDSESNKHSKIANGNWSNVDRDGKEVRRISDTTRMVFDEIRKQWTYEELCTTHNGEGAVWIKKDMELYIK